jgi:hypothetical protein
MFKEAIETIETYRDITGYTLNTLKIGEPSCFNGMVNINRYRITVEKIVESKEILRERLQILWDYGDNHHNWGPLKAVAASLNYKLKGSPGSKREYKRDYGGRG